MNRAVIKNLTVRLEVNNFISLLKQEGVPVRRVILFGSFAKGKTHSFSDIDLAVVASPFTSDRVEEMMVLTKLANKVSDRIEPIPLTEESLASKYDTLAGEIKRYGKVVYEAN